MELTDNPRDNHRQQAATVMPALSRFVTMASIGRIVDEELAKELHKRYGRPMFPIKVPKFGLGHRYAFDVTKDPAEEIDDLKEYLALEGAPQAIRSQIPNYAAYSGRRIADSELESFTAILDELRANPGLSTRPLDVICARHCIGHVARSVR